MFALRAATAVTFVSVITFSSLANADDANVEVVRSQFTDKVEQSNPVAGQDQLAQATRVTYWVAVKNANQPTTITLVWKLDGKESGRQSLDVGTSPQWKTWGAHARFGAKSIEVDVLDASGATIKTDTLAF
jgi:hypothetical protein